MEGELEEIIPLTVNTYKSINTSEIYKSIKHDKLIPYLIKSMQELNSNIIDLRNDIKYLENKINN